MHAHVCACACLCVHVVACVAYVCMCILCVHELWWQGQLSSDWVGVWRGMGRQEGGRRTILLSAGHPLNFNFGNLGQPRSSKINILKHYRYHPGEQKAVFNRGDIKLVQYVEVDVAHV